jgi:putative DNA methylase
VTDNPAGKRLIEVAFPLKQASIDSVHEKNVRHGHISTLHIWPARRPLAACRAALIATLLPDPGNKEERDAILKRLGGTLSPTVKKKKMPNGRVEEIAALETEGGILHWGRESGPDLDWFRTEIRKAYGGRAPKVLDPFAGGGAIPLEAMRLGCEVTAVDINPVAWFILKCTLEYPQKLAGQRRRLPDFALADTDFMAAYLKAKGLRPADIAQYVGCIGRTTPDRHQGELFARLHLTDDDLEADLSWHVRAWGRWVLKRARKDLARFYPTYAEYCRLKPYARIELDTGEPLKLVPVNEDGDPQIDLLNAGFDRTVLASEANPRWIAKPTVAYLWARTVKCKACRATMPLLKTRWLAKKDEKRVVLTMTPNADRTGVVFGIDSNAKVVGGNAAQKREYDKRLGAGTMSRAGAACPCCGTIMTMEDVRVEGRVGRLGAVLTSVVVDAPDGKEFRLPTADEIEVTQIAAKDLSDAFHQVPFGLPTEPTPKGGSGASRAFSVDGYGLNEWHKVYLPRQLIAIARLIGWTRSARVEQLLSSYSADWQEAISAYLGIGVDRIADRCSSICRPDPTPTQSGIINTFSRFALPMTWDFAEGAPLQSGSGGYLYSLEWAARYIEHSSWASEPVNVVCGSATSAGSALYDVIVTDPPYYDAIPYSDLMDFFYVWLRRTVTGLSPDFDTAFSESLAPKWDHETNDGELIDDSSRFAGDKAASKRNYEEGMARAFRACHASLAPSGRLVIVFAHKHPDAWETLVGAIIKAGFVVDGSWPIQTEMGNRTRAISSAALSSSVWLVCRKRDPMTKAGWDAQVIKDMQSNITTQLRRFWDDGIRGPDFVWAATGPALEAYSRYPAVKKASEPGALMGVDEFLRQVRRIVVDFVVGRVLTRGQDGQAVGDHPLDDLTTYYLLHRNDFGMKDAPAGPCILYMVSCNLAERDLLDQYEILAKGGQAEVDDEVGTEGDDDTDASAGSGGKFKLKPWSSRKHRSLGLEVASGRSIPLIDQVHKLMQLWVAGDTVKVNDYLDQRGLRHSHVFAQLIQALIETSRAEGINDECSVLERLANHLKSVGVAAQPALGLE